MFRPVGPQAPAVYWRRRLVVAASVVLLLVLIVVTVRAVGSGGGSADAAASSTTGAGAVGPSGATPVTTPTPTPTPTSPRPSASARSSESSPARHSSPSSSARSTASAPPAACRAGNLTVAAVVGQTAYRVGDKPVVELQVTNTGALPCVQDLADKQVVLTVYNGASRVWGSHDCAVQAGTNDQTLEVNRPVRISISWSGYTSQTGCPTNRQRVGAGTYTLYAALSGQRGRATQFTIG